MRTAQTKLALALLASVALTAEAQAQASYPCVNDAPNPYKLQANWAQTPRPWGPVNTVNIDSHDNLWAFDRCGDEGCSKSDLKPIYELGPNGKTMKNFGAGEFASAHGIAVDKDGNVWAADFQAKDGKGMQVIKFDPNGKVLLKLGKAGEPGMGNDEFNQPTGVAFLSNGDVVIIEGHGSKLNKSRVNIYSKDGKYLRSFASHGTGDGQLTEPHAVTVDQEDRIYVADRTGNRVAVFDKTGKFLANWKQFGRPSGVWVDKNDMLYVADSQSDEKTNPGCKMGIRVGSVKDGKVTAYIPPPPGVTDKMPPPEGVAVDSHGTIYAAAVQMKDVKKYTK
jgi:DNA-binding beta-propeller fold protein YncE